MIPGIIAQRRGGEFVPPGSESSSEVALNYRERAVALGPAAYWRMDETSGTTVADSVGSFTGTANTTNRNQTALVSPSVASIGFTGADASTVAISGNLLPATSDPGPFAFAFWYQGTTTTQMLVWDKNGGTSANRMFLAINRNSDGSVDADKICLFTTDTSVTVAQAATTSAVSGLSDGNPHHIVVSRSGAAVTIVVDGVDRAVTGSIHATAQIHSNNNHRISGALSNQLALNALIDEFAFYTKSLSVSEAQTLYGL